MDSFDIASKLRREDSLDREVFFEWVKKQFPKVPESEARHVGKCLQSLSLHLLSDKRAGHFVESVAANNLIHASLYADDVNRHHLHIYGAFMSRCVPRNVLQS